MTTSSGPVRMGGERGAVAVTLLLLLVLGAAGGPCTGAHAAARRAAEIGVAFEEGVDAARDGRAERNRRETGAEPARDTRRPARPRFRTLDGHAWPPPRAPDAVES